MPVSIREYGDFYIFINKKIDLINNAISGCHLLVLVKKNTLFTLDELLRMKSRVRSGLLVNQEEIKIKIGRTGGHTRSKR